MNTPNNAAALTYMGRQLTAQEAVTMFANQDATIRSLRDELATLRATLAQPDALTSQPSGEAVDTGNYAHDPLYKALDELYGRGWTDYHKGRDYDPRGTNEWQAVLDLFRKHRTHPSADASGEAQEGPEFHDGCSLDGFVGGCERMGCHPSADAPRINIKCEVVDNGIIGTTTLNVVRVNPEDDGSFTAVTDHWPYDAPGVAVANLYAAASKGFHTSETCGLDGKYMHVIKFRSMADLHAYEAAWRAAMIYVRDAALAPKPEGGHG